MSPWKGSTRRPRSCCCWYWCWSLLDAGSVAFRNATFYFYITLCTSPTNQLSSVSGPLPRFSPKKWELFAFAKVHKILQLVCWVFELEAKAKAETITAAAAGASNAQTYRSPHSRTCKALINPSPTLTHSFPLCLHTLFELSRKWWGAKVWAEQVEVTLEGLWIKPYLFTKLNLLQRTNLNLPSCPFFTVETKWKRDLYA